MVNIIDYAIKVGLAGHQTWRIDQAEENATKHKTNSLTYDDLTVFENPVGVNERRHGPNIIAGFL